MFEWEWETNWHSEDEDLPPLGAFIQLRIENTETGERRVLEGIVGHLRVNDETSIGLIPKPTEDFSVWGWVEWRARVVPMREDSQEKERLHV